MKRTHVALFGMALVVAMISVGGAVYYLHFSRHQPALNAELKKLQGNIITYQDWLDDRPPVADRLAEFDRATLGYDAEVVESRFRSGLNRMAASAGLVADDTIVSPRGALAAVRNPAVLQRVSEFRRHLDDERIGSPDLYMIEAEIRGSGTLEAVVRLLALAQSQPWIWNVRGFSLTPQGNSGTMFDINVGVTTAVLPDLAPASAQANGEARTGVEPPEILDPDALHLAATSAIVTRNVFAPPPPPPADPPPVVVTSTDPDKPKPNPPKPVPAPPYHEWRLTGVSGSPALGQTAWMLNQKTGTSLLLSPGEMVLDAVFETADRGEVVFRIGESRYRLALNETLADRHLLE